MRDETSENVYALLNSLNQQWTNRMIVVKNPRGKRIQSMEGHKVTSDSYVLARDIVIPAGTRVAFASHRVNRFVDFASILVAVTKDSTAEWTMPFDEAIELGLITPKQELPQ